MTLLRRAIVAAPRFACKAYAAYIGVVLLAIAFVSPYIDYLCKDFQTQFGILYLLIAAVVGLFLFSFVHHLTPSGFPQRLHRLIRFFEEDSHFRALMILLGIALFAGQLMMAYGCFFVSGWDCEIVTDVDSRAAQQEYFSRNPNNLFLAGFFNLVARVAAFLHIHNYYLLFAIGGLFCTSVAIVLSGFVAKALFGMKWSLFAFLAMGFFVGLNPMCMVPYSDSYGMLFTAIILYSFVCLRNRYVKTALIVPFTYLGYCVKPTAIFVTVAFLIMMFAEGFSTPRAVADRRQRICAFFKTIIVGAIALLLSIGLSVFVTSSSGIIVDENSRFSSAHYLMMGFNEERDGVFASDDVDFSQSFDDPIERDEADIDRWESRVQEMGLLRLSKLMVKKSLINYGSGIFSFLIEGGAFLEVGGDNAILKSWYGIPNACDKSPWSVVSQIAWLMLLLGMLFLLFCRTPNRNIAAIAISLLLLSGFLLLFECRARYLFLYASYFVLLGLAGWKGLIERFAKRTEDAASS